MAKNAIVSRASATWRFWGLWPNMMDTRDQKNGIPPPRHPAEFVFAVAAFLVAIFLLSQIGHQVRWDANRAMHDQPAFWPALAIAGMVVFGAFELFFCRRRNAGSRADDIFHEMMRWTKSLEFAFWFMTYVLAVPIVGYLPATLVFCPLLAWRLGYRSRQHLTAALLTGLSTVVVFKTFLSVKIPGGALYDFLPFGLRNVMTLYF